MIGIIPAIFGESDQYTCPVEMLPAGYFVSEGTRHIKPVIQYTLENMILAGVDGIVVVVNPDKMPLMRHLKDGDHLGLNISYVWQSAACGLIAAIDAAYHLVKGDTVLVAVPGMIVPPAFLPAMARTFEKGEVDAVVAVTPKGVKGRLIGAYCWGPKFTGFLRDQVIAKKDPAPETVLLNAVQNGLNIAFVKPQQFMALYNDWTTVYEPINPIMVKSGMTPSLIIKEPVYP